MVTTKTTTTKGVMKVLIFSYRQSRLFAEAEIIWFWRSLPFQKNSFNSFSAKKKGDMFNKSFAFFFWRLVEKNWPLFACFFPHLLLCPDRRRVCAFFPCLSLCPCCLRSPLWKQNIFSFKIFRPCCSMSYICIHTRVFAVVAGGSRSVLRRHLRSIWNERFTFKIFHGTNLCGFSLSVYSRVPLGTDSDLVNACELSPTLVEDSDSQSQSLDPSAKKMTTKMCVKWFMSMLNLHV